MRFQKLFLRLICHVEQLHCVCNYIFLYFEVERRIGRKTWGSVYLNEPRFQFLVNEHIEAENLKAE